ncbi:hypothetical protein ACIBI9_17705 [Nonomuraea sp. NPDC050451]|uniref:hypothetical protein n=1 Tax=Nonomuraea sp. NPDC050451 TaxID=3364364 RepID=UPI003797645D
MSSRRGGRPATAVALFLAVIGCSAVSDPVARSQPSPRVSTAAPDPRKTALAETAKSLPALLAAQGPVACSWNDDGWRVTAYDDAFRTSVASFSSVTLAPLLTEIAAKADGEEAVVRSLCGDEGDPGVSPVSPDGRRIAVQVDFPSSGDPTHVGWLDLGTGTFVDLTDRSNKKGYVKETFSDKYPGFAPDGSFWFLRDSQQYFSADPNGRLTPRKLSLACFTNSNEDTFYRVVGSVAVMCPGTVHPSGRFAANPSRAAVGINLVQGAELDILANTVDRYGDAPLQLPFGMKIVVRDGGLRHCDPLAWINATDLLCAGGSNDFYTARINSRLARNDIEYVQHTEVKVKDEIAPATESSIITVAVSRDRRSLIIAADENDDPATAKLYRASLISPSAPVEIGPIPAESREHFTLLNNYQQPVRADDTSH